jgi:hypothetical protein
VLGITALSKTLAMIAAALLLSTNSSSSRYSVVKSGEFFIVTGPAEIKYTYGGERILIATDKDTFEVSWPLGRCSMQECLEYDSIYTFVFARKIRVRDTISVLVRVEKRGIMIFDREICPIHKQRMSMEMARIAYGLLIHKEIESFYYADQCFFPNRRRPFVEGGCVVIVGQSPESTQVYVCAQCDSAFAQWTRDNASRK